MTGVWVDTDMGFDDLWALLLLRHLKCPVAGVSLVAGNAPLPQVASNAAAAKSAYGFDWPMWRGADQPLDREQETAARILGPTGMRSRGRNLPPAASLGVPSGAIAAICDWLGSDAGEAKVLLALGPLTNVARLLADAPDVARRIARVVWMGGSAGKGNHSPLAEFNAIADPEAASQVLSSPLPVDIVDLEFCRKVTFGADDLPDTDPLTGDLLGGYLDIALERGRPAMAIYDPVAAIAVAAPEAIDFTPVGVKVSVSPDETYGATSFVASETAGKRLATGSADGLAGLCLDALRTEALNGSRD